MHIPTLHNKLATHRSRRLQNIPSSPPIQPSQLSFNENTTASVPAAPTSPASSVHRCSSSDSSNSSFDFHIMSTQRTTTNNTTSIRFHESHKTPPILDPGRITPAVVMEFQEYATAFFAKTKTPEEEQVTALLTSFREPMVANWAKMNKFRFCAAGFTFPMFMTELRKRFLPPFWENQLFRNIVNAKMLNSESFSDFADRVIAGNNLLEGSKF